MNRGADVQCLSVKNQRNAQHWLVKDTKIWIRMMQNGGFHYLTRNNDWGNHDDVIKWKHFPRYWPCVRESSSHQWRAWTNGWADNRDAGDLLRHRAHNDVTVIIVPWVHIHWADKTLQYNGRELTLSRVPESLQNPFVSSKRGLISVPIRHKETCVILYRDIIWCMLIDIVSVSWNCPSISVMAI